ncbi:poly(U)-specific endoribonuclease-A isoform X2 [Xenopus laevis]|uniref:Protein endoU n=1 Tax=Xenopus laevis TaxID=8355 RepID=A0A8J1M9Y0_XENLA|nr:poly(U)-specific endoribonuclease-A isoform X2 [Xenopus laevis]
MRNLQLLLVLSIGTAILAFDTCPSDRCEDSCKNRCGDKPSKSFGCQCNEKCEQFDDCCHDYHLCLYKDASLDESSHHSKSDRSCKGKCTEKYNKKNSCHCSKKCKKFDNCCSDYETVCGGKASSKDNTGSSSSIRDGGSSKSCSSGTDISNDEIKAVSEKLYKLDVNKAGESDIILNKQDKAHNTREKEDLCDEPLYKYVNEKLFTRPTYAAFIALLDNYDRKTGIDETYCDAEIKEQEHFLQEIMKTKLLKELYSFFQSKGLYKTEKEFVKDLQQMWFGLYSRSTGADSSGFEHVFVGEVKKGIVSGFHSWIRFYMLEKKGLLDYYSYNFDGPWTCYPDVLGKQFYWDGFYKEVGSQFIGSSPEFDFSIYTLCFISRPGKKCKISLGGHGLSIQTYVWTKSTYDNGKKFIATAYAES